MFTLLRDLQLCRAQICHFSVIYLPTIFSLSASDSLYTLAITFMNMRNTDRLPEFRKTLRHIPKEVLRCRNLSTAAQMPPSSPKILPRAPLAPPCLPQLSQVSLSPDFQSGRFGNEPSIVSSIGTAMLLPSSYESLPSLLPSRRLCQANFCRLCTNHAALAQVEVRYGTLPGYSDGRASQRASISTYKNEPSLKSRPSTLRIRHSLQRVPSERRSTLAAGASSSPMPKPQRGKGLRRPATKSFWYFLHIDPLGQIGPEILDTSSAQP